MVAARTSEQELSAWIIPRLEVIQNSIRQAPLTAALKTAIHKGLEANGLISGAHPTMGCCVRSDTKGEDLDNFNGAGLNLTLFNSKSLKDIYDGLKEVWASPFEF